MTHIEGRKAGIILGKNYKEWYCHFTLIKTLLKLVSDRNRKENIHKIVESALATVAHLASNMVFANGIIISLNLVLYPDAEKIGN